MLKLCDRSWRRPTLCCRCSGEQLCPAHRSEAAVRTEIYNPRFLESVYPTGIMFTVRSQIRKSHSVLVILQIDVLWFSADIIDFVCIQDPSLREEVASLRLKLSEREQALQDALESVKSSNRTKDSMEHFIVSQRESLMLSW